MAIITQGSGTKETQPFGGHEPQFSLHKIATKSRIYFHFTKLISRCLSLGGYRSGSKGWTGPWGQYKTPHICVKCALLASLIT